MRCRCCDGKRGISSRGKRVITGDITWAGGGTRVRSGDWRSSRIRVRGWGSQKTWCRMRVASPPVESKREV